MRLPRRGAFRAILLLFCACFAGSANAQQACPSPTIAPPDPHVILFSPQQGMDLGDAVAEHLQREFLVIDDEDITGYLQRVGERLLARAPATGVKYRFLLFDQPFPNAFSMPGGRIYVSRKMVAFVRNEDELASVLGHELGHALLRQSEVEMSTLFREVLGVTQVGDREDVFRKYAQLIDSYARKRKAFRHKSGEEEREQLVADQMGMQLVASAGYSAQAFVDFWDRLAETKGKTGSWLSDLFGTTKPESRRLRELLKQVTNMPAGCVERRAAVPAQEFQKWKEAVVVYSGLGHKERLQGVLAKKTLNPPLRADIQHVRFSPDGKYLLVQDESTIYILLREPFMLKFSIDAPDAEPAQFTPDSQSVVFYTPALRVEKWNIEEEARATVNEMALTRGCQQTELSSDGGVVACLGQDGDLTLYEVGTGTVVFQKKNFYEPFTFGQYFRLLLLKLLGDDNPKIIGMHFSSDGRYFAAGAPGETAAAVDLSTKKVISLPGSVRKLLELSFAFVGPDRLVGVDQYNPKNSAVVKFPSGEVVKKVLLGDQRLNAATNPRYLILRPVKDYPLGVLDLETKKIVMASKMTALDVFGDSYVRERYDGELGMFKVENIREFSKIQLPLGQLGRLRAAALSSDLLWLAISARSRGGLWNLEQDRRAFYVRGFRGAYVDSEGTLYADFPKFGEDARQVGRLTPRQRSVDTAFIIGDAAVEQHGGVLLRTKHEGKDDWRSRNVQLEGLDVRSGSVLWTRNFPKQAPDVLGRGDGERLVFLWRANSDGARYEIKADARLSARWGKVDSGDEDYFLEVVEAATGKSLGAAVVLTGKGSFRIRDAVSTGDWIVVSDTANRLLVYSLSDGEQKGKLFGRWPSMSPGGLLAAENERGQLSVYDLHSLVRRGEYVFTSPIAYASFAPDGKRLFVLTADQTAYVLDMTSSARAAVKP